MPDWAIFGVFWLIYAPNNCIAISSTQIGSLPGETGESGTHFHWFVPLRSSLNASPSLAGQSIMAASPEISSCAALIAFCIFHSSVPAIAVFLLGTESDFDPFSTDEPLGMLPTR